MYSIRSSGIKYPRSTLVKLAIFYITCIIALCSKVPTHEIDGLEYLYNSTNGTNWAWKSDTGHWNFTVDADPCIDQWEGVNCTDGCLLHSACNIISIDLRSYKLIGTIKFTK